MANWDRRFLELAAFYARWSKDPSTQVGAVITRGKQQVSQGYNGFPAGVADLEERLMDRDLKLKYTLHAEENAILTARGDLSGCTCYTWPMQPCARCAGKLAQAGIVRVVAPMASADLVYRWGADFEVAGTIFSETGIELELLLP